MLSHIRCTDMVSPQYESSYACQDYLSLKMLFTLGALIWFLPSGNAPLHRVHWYGFSPIWVIISLSRLLFIENAFFHTGCIDITFPLYESSYAGLDHSSVKMLSHKGCTDMVSPQYESSYVDQEYSYVKCFPTLDTFIFFFARMSFHMLVRSPSANSIGDIEKLLEILV